MLIAGKIILNMSVGIASAVVGVYLTECAPASLRGTLMSNYNIVQNVGYVLAAITVYGVVNRMDTLNWLLPICLQFVLPIAIILCSPLLPESPRWLAGQGRLEEAAAVIRSLRKKSDEYTDEVIWAEVQEIAAAYTEMRQLYSGTGWLELFRGANLRRTLIAIGLQSLQQAQGVSFVSNYTVTTFLSLGIDNVYTIVLILYVVLLVSSLGAFYFPDRVGRRTRESPSSCARVVHVADGTSAPHRILLRCRVDGGPGWYYHRFRQPYRSLGQLPGGFSLPLDGRVCQHLVTHPMVSETRKPTQRVVSELYRTVAAEISANPLREKTLAVASWSGFGVGLAVGFVSPYSKLYDA